MLYRTHMLSKKRELKMKKYFQLTSLLLVGIFMAGCSSVYTSASKSELTTEVHTSHSIFLDPVAPEKRIIYVEIKNTSDKPQLVIAPQVRSQLLSKGYTITQNPEEATYWLQANILKVTLIDGDDNEAKKLDGVVAGAAVGSAFGKGSGRDASMIAGAMLGMAANAAVKDIYVTLVTDVQISVLQPGINVQVAEESSVTTGQGSARHTTVETQSNRKQFRTQIMATANRVNLTFEEAQGALSQGMISALAGLF